MSKSAEAEIATAAPTKSEAVENVVDGTKGLPEEPRSTARTWIQSLSPLERSAAMGFADGPATVALLQRTQGTPQPGTGASHNLQNRTTDGRSVDRVDWRLEVSLEELERMYEGSVDGPLASGSNTGTNNNAQPTESLELELGTSGDRSMNGVNTSIGTTTQAGFADAPDEFRIRDGTQATLTSGQCYLVHDRSSDLLCCSELSSQVERLLEQTCAIFPSAFHFASDAIAAFEDHFPFITIRFHDPSGNHDDCLDIFDRLLAMNTNGSARSFLDGIRIRDTSTWIDHLRDYSEKTSHKSFPLYILLVLRFEFSALRTFVSTPSVLSVSEKSADEPSTATTLSRHARTFAELLDSIAAASHSLPDVMEAGHKYMDMFPERETMSEGMLNPLLTTPLGFLFDKLHTKPPPFDTTIRLWNNDLGKVLKELGGVESSPPPEAEPAATISTKEKPKKKPGKADKFDDDINLAWIDEPSPSPPQRSISQKKSSRKKKKKKSKKKGGNGRPEPEKKQQEAPPAPVVKPDSVTSASPKLQDDNDIAIPVSEDTVDGLSVSSKASVAAPSQTQDSDDDSTVLDMDFMGLAKTDGAKHVPTSQDKGIHLSQLNGVGVNFVVSNASAFPDGDVEDHDDEWETVEVNRRGHKKKSMDRKSSSASQGKKSKVARTPASRKRLANRKMVREILSSVIDSVLEEVSKKVQEPKGKWSASAEKWVSPTSQAKSAAAAVATSAPKIEAPPKHNLPKEGSLREVSLKQKNIQNTAQAQLSRDSESFNHHNKATTKKSLGAPGANGKTKGHLGPFKRHAVLADQNTAPTVQETLSAVSTNSTGADVAQESNAQEKSISRDHPRNSNESVSGGSIEVALPQRQSSESPTLNQNISPSPPLPTLLSPENANSASSSVASSLDAPHSSRHHFSGANENDVGYHLLSVCDRLTRDMGVFMARRSHALGIRRKERGVIISALQECVSTLWPSQCNVDLYGSCATLLDLPSSDLDVLVCGLAWDSDPLLRPNSSPSDVSSDSGIKKSMSQTHWRGNSENPSLHGQLSLNAERVVRLAKELECQPWAVQVKAIPTARVPVIKILADPARLSGAGAFVNGEEWMMQQMPSDATMASQYVGDEGLDHGNAALPSYHLSQWRGADVVNGLFKVDITFEGPEHGGISSTEFSASVIQEFCNETGMMPEGTPAVQTLMVLKELLAQRRLNEPFSGGLSSYALLILVISLVRERRLIREELERVERHRRMVAAGGGNAAIASVSASSLPSRSKPPKRESQPATEGSKKPVTDNVRSDRPKEEKQTATSNDTAMKSSTRSSKIQGTLSMAERISNAINGNGRQRPAIASTKSLPNNMTANTGLSASKRSDRAASQASSWASIAKKKNSGGARPRPGTDNVKGARDDNTKTKPQSKISSFADAVANGMPAKAPRPTTSKPAASTQPPDQANTPNQAASTTQQPANQSTAKVPPQKSEISKTTCASDNQNSAFSNVAASNFYNNSTENGSRSIGNGFGETQFPQGIHDVVEVLCSGEATPGKLLMHFLLFYGHHFDSHSSAIDYSGSHEREFAGAGVAPMINLSPYIQRRTQGSYNPTTGMFTVDPIVVYDPSEGTENKNVARSCFAWSSIRWVFAQSYMTLSSAVEMSATALSGNNRARSSAPDANSSGTRSSAGQNLRNGPYNQDELGILMGDPSASLLELLLSF